MGPAAAVTWAVAVAMLIAIASAGEAAVAAPDLVGFAVAVLAGGLVLSARLGAVDGADPRAGITDYT